MPENRFSGQPAGMKETVCIETNRILDSCKDRDCFENVRVFLTEFGNEVIERTGAVRVRSANIAWTYIGIDPVAFNRGFYTVHIRFYIRVCCEACVGSGRSQEFEGIAVVEKHVILYGSESVVNIFRSNPDATDYCAAPTPAGNTRNVPIAVVEVVDPIVLSARVVEEVPPNPCCCCCCSEIPEMVSSYVDGPLSDGRPGSHVLVVSVGLFSVVRIVRPAQYLVSACEYTVPDKECVCAGEDDPCSVFRSMAFPTQEFNPPPFPGSGPCGGGNCQNFPSGNGKCGCGN